MKTESDEAAQPSSEDVRELSKWLNEESTAPINRQALSRVLAAQPARVACAQCQKPYTKSGTAKWCPKCAPGLVVSEAEFQKPISAEPARVVDATAPALGSITSMQHPTPPGGFQDCEFKPAGHDYPAAPTLDTTAKCSPTLTQCPRCNNPHNACDQGAAPPPPSQAGAVTELEVMQNEALKRMYGVINFPEIKGSPDSPLELARAALAAFEAKKAGV